MPEVGLRFNVVLIFPVFKIVLHNVENPLNCSAASSTLVGSKLTSQVVQEIGTHTKIIAVRWVRESVSGTVRASCDFLGHVQQ